ncbi:sensor histidine kinase [Vallitalea longa]|nr:HAMP domain-containing sensor histidine kinase [Vallitalea longa]
MLRNREFRQFAILFFLMDTTAIIVGFAINKEAGILAIVFTTAIGIVFFLFTKARYKSIASISNQIDLVLHNADRLYIGDSDEGELSILHSEVTKMTLRIREQNDALKKEKEHLADSLADIAHQLRTPLTSANLILSLLAKNPDENDRKAFLRETEELLVQMDWLITSLLKLSRLDAGIVVFQSEQIDVNKLICTAIRPFLIPMELHGIQLQIDVPKEVIIQGDSGWLSEGIQNIIKNCIESAGENGKIKIICTHNPLFTEIRIQDNGTGFKKEDLPCLFDRFYRGKNSNATGYGIGLALCKMIITRQDGTITAKNHPQGGAVFTIRFPKVTNLSPESHRDVS